MDTILFVFALILVVAWVIGLVGFHAGRLIHILFVLAIIVILLRVIRGDNKLI